MGFIEGRRQELKDTKANQLRELEIALEKEKLQMKKYIVSWDTKANQLRELEIALEKEKLQMKKDIKANQLRELEIALEKETLQMKKYIDFVALVLTPRLMLDMSRARAVHAGPKKKAQAVSPEDS
eukprot:gene5218-18446_t